MKRKKFMPVFLILLSIFILVGCADEEKTSGISAEEMRFEGILVGETSYEDLKNLDITPLEDIDMSELGNLTTEPMSEHYLKYEGFEVSVDEIVQNINISEDYTGTFWQDVQMGDSLDEILSKLPQEPTVYEMRENDSQLQEIDDNKAHLICYYNVFDELFLKHLLVYAANGEIGMMLDFAEDDTLTHGQIFLPSNE